MSLAKLGFIYGVICIIYGMYFRGILVFFYFLTSWGTLIEVFTLMNLAFKNTKDYLTRKLLITS